MKNKVSVFSYPKINLALDILRKDSSGYHEIQTVFHQLKEPRDEIILEEAEDGILEVKSDNPKVPTDETNTVLKAALLLKKQMNIKKGARIFIKKRIPLMSGLGGGSRNAVAALQALARLWGVKCPLLHIASQIGMDCAFLFSGGTALGEHFGEKITPLPLLPSRIKIQIIDTGVQISSAWAYQNIDIIKCAVDAKKTERLICALHRGDEVEVLNNLHNDFEEFIFEKYPALLKKKREIESKKSGRVFLCGSGGALVRIYS